MFVLSLPLHAAEQSQGWLSLGLCSTAGLGIITEAFKLSDGFKWRHKCWNLVFEVEWFWLYWP